MSAADLELAERAARAAGAVLLERYGRTPSGLATKSSGTDPVSDADREAERVLRELLLGERPDDGLLGEEGSHSDGRSGRRWIVDPLDGTVNYLYGFPAWSVSVALEDAQGGLVGVVYDPVAEELFRAARGAGASLVSAAGRITGADADDARTRDRTLRVRKPVPLGEALVATGFAYRAEQRAAQAEVVRELLPRVRDIRRAGSAALDLCAVAAGRVDAYYERGTNPWDVAAATLICREAGGTVLELAEEPVDVVESGGAVVDLPGKPHGVTAASDEALAHALHDLVV